MPVIVRYTVKLRTRQTMTQYVRDEYAPNTADDATRFATRELAEERADEILENMRGYGGLFVNVRPSFTFVNVDR